MQCRPSGHNILVIDLLDGVAIVEKIADTKAPFYRPPLPQQDSEGVHPVILTLMKQCWAEEPSERPSFVEVAKILKSVNHGKSVFLHSCDFYCAW